MTRRCSTASSQHANAAARRWPAWIAGAALVVAAAITAPHAHAALYKWVDSNGRTVYSDIPPSGDIKAERINGPAAPANPNAVKDMVGQEADLKKRQMQRVDDETKSEKAKADAAKRQEQCSLMRGQLKALQMDSVQHYRINEKGERVYLDDAAHKAEIENARQFIATNCP